MKPLISRSGRCWSTESVSISGPSDTDLESLRYRLDVKYQLCKMSKFKRSAIQNNAYT